MNITDAAAGVDDTVERHPPKFEDVDFLPVQARHFMIGVGQTDKREPLSRPVFLKGFHIIGTDRQNLRAARLKFGIVIAQARQLRAAMRSHKAAQKSKENGFAAMKTGKTDDLSIYIGQFEIGGGFSGGDDD